MSTAPISYTCRSTFDTAGLADAFAEIEKHDERVSSVTMHPDSLHSFYDKEAREIFDIDGDEIEDFMITSLADLKARINRGEIDPTKLAARVDNDCISFDYEGEYDDEGREKVGPGVRRERGWDPNPRVALEEALQLLLGCEIHPV